MTRWRTPFVLVASVALALLAVGPVLAHGGGGDGISVEPDSAQAGDTVVLAGQGLEPNSDRVLVLAGPDITIDLGSVTTDAEGMFQKEIKIPAHLLGGAYEFRAIGDETLVTGVAITAAAGMAGGASSGTDAEETVQAYQPGPLTEGLLIGGALALLAIGGLLVWGAERFGHSRTPAGAV